MSTKILLYSMLVLVFFATFSFSLGKNNEPELFSLIKSRTRRSLEPLIMVNQVTAPSSSSPQIFNVDDFGAKADGTDDSQAFNMAWNRACSSKEDSVVFVPNNKVYQLKPIKFSGSSCMSNVIIRITGVIKASPDISDYEKDRSHWIQIEGVKNLKVEGGGSIDGNGNKWWPNSCKINKSLPCNPAPTAVTFNDCTDLVVDNLKFTNAQQIHLTFQNCMGVQVSKLTVTSPGDSPNTDGIHITNTQNVQITNSNISTGDDCISIVSGSKNVNATDINCGPGHGISIGSLEANNAEAEVSFVHVNRANFTETTNGVRIKTWQGGSGFAKDITFENILMKNVSNPIIIDQNYCDQKETCQEQKSAVQISNVKYNNIRGTSASKVAVNLKCSKSFPCKEISLENINLTDEGNDEKIEATCENVSFQRIGSVSPMCSSPTVLSSFIPNISKMVNIS